jgi:hypothetical protein
MFQEKGEVATLADDVPGLGPTVPVEKQATDALCTLRKKWLDWLMMMLMMVGRLGTLQEQTIFLRI